MMISEIPSVFQSKVRLAVVAALLTGPKSFKSLKTITEATDGNLGRQLEILEEEHIISVEKSIAGRRVNSTYSLTPAGRRLFTEYIQLLQDLMDAAGDTCGAKEA